MLAGWRSMWMEPLLNVVLVNLSSSRSVSCPYELCMELTCKIWYSNERLQPVELLLQGALDVLERGTPGQALCTSSKSGKPLQTLIGQLQALMTSSSISSGRETIVNSAADIGNWIGSSAGDVTWISLCQTPAQIALE